MKRFTFKFVISAAMIVGLMFATLTDGIAAKGAKGRKWAKNHPAMNKDNQTEQVEKNEINRDEKNGTLTKAEGQADKKNINSIHQEERADAQANGGHLTAAEQTQINGQLHDAQGGIKAEGGKTVNVQKAVARREWDQSHPAMHHDNQIEGKEGQEVRQDMKNGTLTKAQGQAELQNINSIHQEERADAQANGGHLSAAEQSQINGQLSGVQGSVKADGGKVAPVRAEVFDQNHPRAARDLRQVHRDEGRLNEELKSGKIDQATYDKEMGDLHSDAKTIRSDVRSGGYINGQEQSQIRKDLGEDTKEIKGQNAPPPPVTPPAPVPTGTAQ